MGTFKEENAITFRIAKMRRQWINEVKDCTALVRWSVERNEIKMVESFCLLEGSDHGKLPELFLNFQIPFHNKNTYAGQLIENWLLKWNSEEARNEVASLDVLPEWDQTPYEHLDERDHYLLFLACMSSFAHAISEDTTLVLYLTPLGYDNNFEFKEWLITCLEHLPKNLKIVLYDLEDHEVFGDLPEEIKVATLVADLNMHGAMKEIAAAGDANDPSTKFNLCILNMGEATGKNDIKELNHWGNEAINVARQIKLKSLEVAAYLAYGSNLYQLNKFDGVMNLYHQAEIVTNEGIEEGDATCTTLLLQVYNFKATLFLKDKDYQQAENYYQKAASEAQKQQNNMMHLEMLRQAAIMAENNKREEEAYAYLLSAYEAAKLMDEDTQKYSSMLLVVQQLYQYAAENEDHVLEDDIDGIARNIWGGEWLILNQVNVNQELTT